MSISPTPEPVHQLLTALRAAGEPTRLRIIALLAHAELSVSELVQILGQSQPRVSRHLKLLGEAGLLDRNREGPWAFFRLAEEGEGAEVARSILALLPENDALARLDLERLRAVQRDRGEQAAAYFRANAADWRRLRALYVDETEVERAVLRALGLNGAASGSTTIGDVLDVGTGTGRILEVLAPFARRACGVDVSHEMLAVARATLDGGDHRHVQVRHGDMYTLAFPAESFDIAVFHQVLHYAEDPARAVAEAARVLRPGGQLLVVDFAPHSQEFLRAEQAHSRLGLADGEVLSWCRAAGLEERRVEHLPGDPLTVTLWLASRPSGRASASPTAALLPVAELVP